MFKRLFFLFTLVVLATSSGIAQNDTVNPYSFIATLQWDASYLDYFFTRNEMVFPVSYRFNDTQDGNGDNTIDVEDNLENTILYAIGNNLFGEGKGGLVNRGPNDQRPVVYFHLHRRENHDVYEYWLYYTDNDYLNDHEHDWEKYFVYVQDETPLYVRISTHGDFNTFSWCELTKDNGHPIIGVDGGAHAMNDQSRDGVQIRYNGDISKNDGRLDVGDGETIPWRIFTNDTAVFVQGAIPFNQTPNEFYSGDPYYPYIPGLSESGEYVSGSDAPWMRTDWDDPSTVPIPYLGADAGLCDGESIVLNAGSNHSTYLWSDGSGGETLEVTTSGVYSVLATDQHGCVSADTIVIISAAPPTSAFTFSSNGLVTSFENQSVMGTNYLWDFGDGNSSTEVEPEWEYAQEGTYQVCLEAFNGCFSDTVCETVTVMSTGLADYSSAQSMFTVYPNPTSGLVHFRLPENEESPSEIILFDMTGRQVFSGPFQSTIDVSALGKGNYVLTIAGDERTYRRLLAVQ